MDTKKRPVWVISRIIEGVGNYSVAYNYRDNPSLMSNAEDSRGFVV